MTRPLPVLLALAVAASAQTADELLERARRAIPIVERVRDLPFKERVEMLVLDEDQVRKRFLEGYDEDFPVEEARGLEAAYARLGLIPPDMDLRQAMYDLEVSEVAAFYDQKDQKLCLRAGTKDAEDDDGPVKWTDMVAVHELTHALQDQYHHLKELDEIPLVDKDGDVSYALSCVTEGEAMLVMLARYYEANGVDMPGPKALETLASKMTEAPEDKDSPLAKAPRFLRESLTSPYAIGLGFVAAVKRDEGWTGVSDLFRRIPSSTEQVLHPRKYMGDRRDDPMRVTVGDLAAALPKGYGEVARDSLGEFGTRIRLAEIGAPEAAAIGAAEGWDGDEFVAWNDGQKAHTVIAWPTTWDSEGDARQFFLVLRDALAKRYAVATATIPRGEDAYAWKTEDGGVAIEMRGRDVFSVEGVPDDADAAKAFLAAVREKTVKEEIVSVIEEKK